MPNESRPHPTTTIQIHSLEDGTATVSGGFARFGFATTAGPVDLLVPAGELPALIRAVGTAAAWAKRNATGNPGVMAAVPVESVQPFRKDQDFLISFGHPGGAETTVLLDGDQTAFLSRELSRLAAL